MKELTSALLKEPWAGHLVGVLTNQQVVTDSGWKWRSEGFTVRFLRGAKMRTLEGLFDEFAAALQFPYYFGENWPAFDECLSDLEWLALGEGLVIVLLDAQAVLGDAHAAEIRSLIETFGNAGAVFAKSIADGEWWDRPAVPVHVVLQSEDGEFGRWTQAGASVDIYGLPDLRR